MDKNSIFFMFKNFIILFTLLIFLCGNCFAEAELLSENQLGDVIAAEGVCNIKVVDGCNTSPELKLSMGTNKPIVDLSNVINTTNADNAPEVVLPPQITEYNTTATLGPALEMQSYPDINNQVLGHTYTTPPTSMTSGNTTIPH